MKVLKIQIGFGKPIRIIQFPEITNWITKKNYKKLRLKITQRVKSQLFYLNNLMLANSSRKQLPSKKLMQIIYLSDLESKTMLVMWCICWPTDFISNGYTGWYVLFLFLIGVFDQNWFWPVWLITFFLQIFL